MSGTVAGSVLGVHLAAGTAALAFVDAGGGLVDTEDVRRLVPSPHMGLGATEHDYLSRARQVLRGCRPDTVAILNTRSYKGWKYADAVARVSLETCWRLAAIDVGCRVVLVKQEHAAKVLGITGRTWTASDLASAVADRVESKPAYWDKRCLAFVAAVVAGSDSAGGEEGCS